MIAIAEIGIPEVELWNVDWIGDEERLPHDYIGNWLWDDGGCILWDNGGVIAL